MSDLGWLKLWRKVLDSVVWKNQNLWRTWSWCLLKASHKKHKIIVGFQLIELMPGQFVYGRKKAAKETGLSEQTIRTTINKLKKLQKLTIKPTNKFSIITINNWDSYQGTQNETNQQNNQVVTSNQPASNHKQECKNEKNVKNVKPKDKKLFGENSDEFRLGEYLYARILENNPNHLKPDFQLWAIHFDYMIRIDKRTAREIAEVILWAQNDDFWKSNILSPKKLREKFDQLSAKMQPTKLKPQVISKMGQQTAANAASLLAKYEKEEEK